MVVKNGGLLNATTITTANAGANDRVVIKDGGQVKSDNPFYATIEKDITGYGAENVGNSTGWYLVAPTTQVMAVPTFVPQIGSEPQFDQMDFYWFNGNQELEWINPKCPAEGGCDSPWGIIPQGHFSAEVAQPLHGYLYARQEDGTLQFAAGTMGNTPFPATNQNTNVGLTFYSDVTDAPLNGWNLIGNPYTCNAYLLDEDGETIPFYRMNETGDAIVAAQPGTAIKPCEGVFVVCPGDGQSHQAVFTTTAPATVSATPDNPEIMIPVHALLGNQDAATLISTLTQTITLSEGWNWVSLYITADSPVALLDMLKEGLGDNALQIQASNGGVTEFDGEDWFGDLDDEGISNEQAYWIETSAACTVELTGVPAVVDEYEITINPGWNWIGFPSAEPIDVADALANFDAEETDQIQCNDATSTEFDGEEWFGDLETFTPGQGYKYYSASDETKILVFTTAAKKKLNNANPTRK